MVLPVLFAVTAAVWIAILYPRSTPAGVNSSTQTNCCGGGPSGSPIGLRELDFPYYSLRDGFSSTLNLVSDSPKPTDLTIAIYSQRGSTVLTSATIQPNAKLPFDLRTLLTSLGADVNGEFGEGSIGVNFEGTIMPVVGQVTTTNPALRLVHESEMVENDPGRTDIPPILNGLWWNLAPGRDARIMVANMSVMPVSADVYLDYGGQRHANAPLSFSPHELKVLSVIDLPGQQNASPGEAPEGGITIVQRGGVPKLIAQGKILDSVTGFSTTLHFPSPELEYASALHAVGIPIGTPSKDSPFAGMGHFTPHTILRNLTAVPQTVTLTVEYPTAPGWDSTDDRMIRPAPGAKSTQSSSPPAAPDPKLLTGQNALDPIVLPGYSSEDVSLDSVLGELPRSIPYGSIRIQHSGAPGSLVAEVSSVEHSKDLVVDAKIRNEGNGWAGSGANPWHLDSETESLVFLTNMGDKAVPVSLKIWTPGGVYYLANLRLSAHETRVVNLRTLRDSQQPDPLGNKIPAGASDGSVLWIRGDAVPVMGRVSVVKRHGGVASTYDCCTCPCPRDYVPYTLYTTPSTDTIADGGNVWYDAYGYEADCNSTQYLTFLSYYSTWSSGNTSVATVASGDATGTGGGSTDIYASYDGCTWWNDHQGLPQHGPAAPETTCTCSTYHQDTAHSQITVQVPAKIVFHNYPPNCSGGLGPVQIITNGSVVDCGGITRATNFCGVNRNEVYQLEDSTGAPFQAAYTWQEAFSNYSTTNPALEEPTAKSANVQAGGYLTDAQFAGFTYPSCLGSNDHLSYTQTSTVTVNGKQFPLSTVVSISLGRFSGTYEDNVSITTP